MVGTHRRYTLDRANLLLFFFDNSLTFSYKKSWNNLVVAEPAYRTRT